MVNEAPHLPLRPLVEVVQREVSRDLHAHDLLIRLGLTQYNPSGRFTTVGAVHMKPNASNQILYLFGAEARGGSPNHTPIPHLALTQPSSPGKEEKRSSCTGTV